MCDGLDQALKGVKSGLERDKVIARRVIRPMISLDDVGGIKAVAFTSV